MLVKLVLGSFVSVVLISVLVLLIVGSRCVCDGFGLIDRYFILVFGRL